MDVAITVRGTVRKSGHPVYDHRSAIHYICSTHNQGHAHHPRTHGNQGPIAERCKSEVRPCGWETNLLKPTLTKQQAVCYRGQQRVKQPSPTKLRWRIHPVHLPSSASPAGEQQHNCKTRGLYITRIDGWPWLLNAHLGPSQHQDDREVTAVHPQRSQLKGQCLVANQQKNIPENTHHLLWPRGPVCL